MLDLTEVYRIGGAQSIALWRTGRKPFLECKRLSVRAINTSSPPKRQVYGVVDIDMVAGPSEVAIVADETCEPSWIAADLLAQAEHDEMAGVWLITWSRDVAAAVFDEVQVTAGVDSTGATSPATAIVNNGITFIVAGQNEAIDLVNHIAPEHVEVLMAEPEHVSDNIKNAGAVFIGTLCADSRRRLFCRSQPRVADEPDGAISFRRWALPDFLKRTSIIRYSGRAIERFGEMIEKFAIAEGLTAHARSITIRRHKA